MSRYWFTGAQARASKFKPFLPENKWFTFKFPPKLMLMQKAIEIAIGKTAETILNPPIEKLGIKGIKFFADPIYSGHKTILRMILKLEVYEVTYIISE